MNAEKILQSNLLDLLFENRNKHYGAYALRSQYNQQVYKALGFIFLLTLLVLILSRVKNEVIKYIPIVIADPPEKAHIIQEVIKPPVIPKTPASKPKGSNEKTTTYTSHINITRDSVKTTILPANLDSMEIGLTNTEGTEKKMVGIDPVPSEAKKDGPAVNGVNKETPLAFAEQMPEFPGGKNALQKFLERNLKSPADIDEGEVVTVKIKFIVGYDGLLKGFDIVEDGGKLFNNEVIRVLKKMPQWTPGKSQGQNVSVYYTIPVKFTATD